MAKQPAGPEPWTPIESDIDGRIFRGRYRVVDNQMQVTLEGYDAIERGDVDRTPPEGLARIMFGTLIGKLKHQERAAAEAKKKGE